MDEKNIVIFTAIEINPDLKNDLESKLIQKFGSFPIKYKVDESILTGIILKIGDTEHHFDLKSEINFILSQILN